MSSTRGNITIERQVYRRSPQAVEGSPFPQSLQLVAEPISLQTPTSLLIQVHAVSLNYRDANMLNGTNPWPVAANGVPCSDCAGSVIAVGSQVSKFKVGDRVTPVLDQKAITGNEQEREWLGGEVDGVLATHVMFEQEGVVQIPAGLNWAEACLLPNAGLTAWSGLGLGHTVVAGKTILLMGTGGVSMMALKLARAAGCKVIITSSSDEKLARIQEIDGGGAVSTINYRTYPEWDQEALRLNAGRGVDVLLETGGTPTLLKSIKATARNGTISQIGYLAAQDPKDMDGLLHALIEKAVLLRGINVGSRRDFEDMNKLIEAGQVSFEDIIDKTFPFSDGGKAFEYLWSGQHLGKVVIKVVENDT